MLSAPSFQLSGSGWYASDFKDKKFNKSPENSQNITDKSEAKPAESDTKSTGSDTKTTACNPGCACH